jgi:hypothetical protein
MALVIDRVIGLAVHVAAITPAIPGLVGIEPGGFAPGRRGCPKPILL